VIASQSVSLAQQIERAQQANEAKIAASVSAPKFNLDTEVLLHLRHFKAFCQQHGVRHCPARPATVAAFIKNEAAAGVSPERIEEGLRAIELAHTNQNLANPVACPAPRAELQKLIGTEAPRSWKKSEGHLFASLPPEVRAIVSRRARQDEIALRKLQNEVSALRKSTTERTNNA